MIRYNNRPGDSPGNPALPLRIIVNESIFKNLYQYMIQIFLTEKRIDIGYVKEVNKELIKRAVVGFDNVDFNDSKNKEALNNLTEEMWILFLPIFRKLIRRHNRNFKVKK